MHDIPLPQPVLPIFTVAYLFNGIDKAASLPKYCVITINYSKAKGKRSFTSCSFFPSNRCGHRVVFPTNQENCMAAYEFYIADYAYVATGAAVLCSGGGGSYTDAMNVVDELSKVWQGVVVVQDYQAGTNCCALAMIGSPDAGDQLTLGDIQNSISNTLNAFTQATGAAPGCAIAGEIGPINTLVPLIAATMASGPIRWVVNGDGAGRATPEIVQSTFAGASNFPVSPSALANDADGMSTSIQSAILNAPTPSQVEAIAGGVVSAFGSFAGIAVWPSNASNNFALQGNYVPNTIVQVRALGQYLLSAEAPPITQDVAFQITNLTGRAATSVLTNFYITEVTQTTNAASFDVGIIRFDNTPDPSTSTETHYLYNLNESLILYSASTNVPDIVAPDSICYYSEATGRGFTNTTDDLAQYFDFKGKKSTGVQVSIIKVTTAPQLYNSPGVLPSFASLLRSLGYAGALPSE